MRASVISPPQVIKRNASRVCGINAGRKLPADAYVIEFLRTEIVHPAADWREEGRLETVLRQKFHHLCHLRRPLVDRVHADFTQNCAELSKPLAQSSEHGHLEALS